VRDLCELRRGNRCFLMLRSRRFVNGDSNFVNWWPAVQRRIHTSTTKPAAAPQASHRKTALLKSGVRNHTTEPLE
jgi:hypothetical protein